MCERLRYEKVAALGRIQFGKIALHGRSTFGKTRFGKDRFGKDLLGKYYVSDQVLLKYPLLGKLTLYVEKLSRSTCPRFGGPTALKKSPLGKDSNFGRAPALGRTSALVTDSRFEEEIPLWGKLPL